MTPRAHAQDADARRRHEALPGRGIKPLSTIRWAVLWRSNSAIDGRVRQIHWGTVCGAGAPHLFATKKECAAFIREHYGYIAGRKDLRGEPHGWLMPKPVRVQVRLSAEAGR